MDILTLNLLNVVGVLSFRATEKPLRLWSEMGDSDFAIRVEGLGKKYTIKYDHQVWHNSLFGTVAHQAASLIRCNFTISLAGQLSRARRNTSSLHDTGEKDFWAQKDVRFEICRG